MILSSSATKDAGVGVLNPSSITSCSTLLSGGSTLSLYIKPDVTASKSSVKNAKSNGSVIASTLVTGLRMSMFTVSSIVVAPARMRRRTS